VLGDHPGLEARGKEGGGDTRQDTTEGEKGEGGVVKEE